MVAIRMLFSWLTEKGILAMNPAREVKTERFSRTEGKTPAFVELQHFHLSWRGVIPLGINVDVRPSWIFEIKVKLGTAFKTCGS
jgi:hypothetical protein